VERSGTKDLSEFIEILRLRLRMTGNKARKENKKSRVSIAEDEVFPGSSLCQRIPLIIRFICVIRWLQFLSI
jgi:hypothetical protein